MAPTNANGDTLEKARNRDLRWRHWQEVQRADLRDGRRDLLHLSLAMGCITLFAVGWLLCLTGGWVLLTRFWK